MKPSILRTLPLAALALATLTPGVARAGDEARYQVTFERIWSEQTHPQDFPLLAHFSPVIGATHDAGFSLFADGSTASPGIEKLCEEGKHEPLTAELAAARAGGHVGAVIETQDPIRSAPGRAVSEFTIDTAHPMVSIAAMIAPSPDWCAVAPGVSLVEDGTFVERRTVTLYAWDAGTDSATSYRAFDDDTQPRDGEHLNDSPYFVRDGQRTPVGTVTFVRK